MALNEYKINIKDAIINNMVKMTDGNIGHFQFK